MLRNILIVVAVALAAIVVFATYSFFRKRTPAEKLEALRKEVRQDGGVVFETDIASKHLTFLLLSCKVYLLDTSGEKIERTQVLRTGFNLWFTPCMGQKIWTENGFVMVDLENRALGAGGGNTSGGHYRSKDGVKWEKLANKGWFPVEQVQN
ncbi:MAG TPA: hypothetical protein VGL53_07810 [Bryobacteraceae bacterium]|jgi:hypothetical protein